MYPNSSISDVFWTKEVQMVQKVVDAIRSLVNARDLQIKCARLA